MPYLKRPYVPPVVKDYGDVWDMTATAHPVLGTVTHGDLSWSNPMYPRYPNSGVGPGSSGHTPQQLDQNLAGKIASTSTPSSTSTPTSGTSGTAGHGTTTTGSSSTGGGTSSPAGGSSGGAGGGTLPFTGLAVGALAAAGSGFAVAGSALRRALRKRPSA